MPSNLSNKLTEKELRLAYWVAKGKTNSEIAKLVGRTEQGVKNLLRTVYDALGFSSRVELAMYVVKEQLLSEATNTSILPRSLQRKSSAYATAGAN